MHFQVVALASLQPDHITLSGQVLDQLASLPATDEIKPLSLLSSVTESSGM